MTATETATLLPSLSIPLPGVWLALPLDEPGRVLERVDGLSRLLHDRHGDAFPVGETRGAVLDVIASSLDHDACAIYVCLELTAGLAPPVSLRVCWPYLPLVVSADLDGDLRAELLAELADVLHGAQHPDDEDVVTLGGLRARRVRELGEHLEVEHWLLADGADRPARLVWSLHAGGLKDEWLALLDGIAAHTQWGPEADSTPDYFPFLRPAAADVD